MKREGRQHGMVRCVKILPQLLNSRPEPRYINQFDSRPTTELLTRVSNKPTNHSKFTGKCGRPRCRGCHESPVCKSKDKAKGTQKLRSRNVPRVTWGIMDGKPEWRLSGFSATGFLDQMDREAYGEYIDDYGLYEESGDIASLADDFKVHDDDQCEIKGFDDDYGNEEIYDAEFVWYDWICYENKDWCFVEQTF